MREEKNIYINFNSVLWPSNRRWRRKEKDEMEGKKERKAGKGCEMRDERDEREDMKKVRDRNAVLISEAETSNTREQSQ